MMPFGHAEALCQGSERWCLQCDQSYRISEQNAYLSECCESLLSSDVRRGLLDLKTKQHLMSGFANLRMNTDNAEAYNRVMGTLGSIRWLVELHWPGLKMRKVGVDVHSLLPQ